MALSLQPITYRDPFSDCESFTVESVRTQVRRMVKRREQTRLDRQAAELPFTFTTGLNPETAETYECEVYWSDVVAFAASVDLPVQRAFSAIKRDENWREDFEQFCIRRGGGF